MSKENQLPFALTNDEKVSEKVNQSEIVRCKDCKHRSEDRFCHIDIEGVGYKKTHEDGFCDKGERKS